MAHPAIALRRGAILPGCLSFTCLAGTGLWAQPQFFDRATDLPVSHVYDGGWEYFVGGGVAIFDCNGDTLPDLYVAGGANPAALLINQTGPDGAIRFGAAPCPPSPP